MSLDYKVAQDWLEEIREADQSGRIALSDWEQDFINSIDTWCESARDLTDKQAAIVQKIHEKCTRFK